MLTTPICFCLSSSNKRCSHIQIYNEEALKFLSKLSEEVKNLSNIEQCHNRQFFEIMNSIKENKAKHINQEKVFDWLSTLKLVEKKTIFTIKEPWLIKLISQLLSLYKKENNATLIPKKEMDIFFNNEGKNFSQSNFLNSKLFNYDDFSLNGERKNNSNKNEFKKFENEPENCIINYKNYFILKLNEGLIQKERKFENDFIKNLNFAYLSNDKIITLSEELLSDFEKFKKFFKFFSNGNCFNDWLTPKSKDKAIYFPLPPWVSEIKSGLTIFQVIAAYLEQRILLHYIYFLSTNRIYQAPSDEKIIKFYNEIADIVSQLSYDKKYFEKIFSEDIIKRNCIKGLLNNTIYSKIYNELKEYIGNIDNDKEKIIKLLKKLTFISFDETKDARCIFYIVYKNFILAHLKDEISKTLNKNDERKNKNEIMIRNDVAKTGNKNEILEKKIILLKEKEVENKINELNNSFPNEKKENSPRNNNDLIRILSSNSLSTVKSSNYQEGFSSNGDDNSSSINEDFNQNLFINNNLLSPSNIINPNIMPNAICNKNYYYPMIFPINLINNIYFFPVDYQNNNNQFCSNNNFFYNLEAGINTYGLITERNVSILNIYKSEILEIVKEEIIKPNLKNKYDLQFGEYGSSVTGTSVEGSDLDVCIIFKKLTGDNKSFKEDLHNILNQYKNNEKGITYEIKDKSSKTKPRITIKVDISEKIKKTPLDNNLGYLAYKHMNFIKIDFTFTENEQYLVDNMNHVEFIKNQIRLYPQIVNTIRILKRFLKKRKMNNFYKGGISSYELFLMILYVVKNFRETYPYSPMNQYNILNNTFEIFSNFDFENSGIDRNSKKYQLYNNQDKLPYIINPLNGLNVAENGKCRGGKINKNFKYGNKLLQLEKNNFEDFCCGDRSFRPFILIINLFK